MEKTEYIRKIKNSEREASIDVNSTPAHTQKAVLTFPKLSIQSTTPSPKLQTLVFNTGSHC